MLGRAFRGEQFAPPMFRSLLSYIAAACQNAQMRKPDRYELEFTILLFVVLAPLGYAIMQMLFHLIGS